MKRKVEITLTMAQAKRVNELIDSFEELMAHHEQSNYRRCLKAAELLSDQISAEVARIERADALDAKFTAMLGRFRLSKKASTP